MTHTNQPKRAELVTTTFETADPDFHRAIQSAIINQQQFSASHDGDEWSLTVLVPIVESSVMPIEDDKVLA